VELEAFSEFTVRMFACREQVLQNCKLSEKLPLTSLPSNLHEITVSVSK
jgi:hypothetical protein